MLFFNNRVAAFLAGCPDHNGVLYLPAKPAPRPPAEPPVPAVTHLALPATGLHLIDLSQRTGLGIHMLVCALKTLGLWPPVRTRLDFETARRLCGHFGVEVTVQS